MITDEAGVRENFIYPVLVCSVKLCADFDMDGKSRPIEVKQVKQAGNHKVGIDSLYTMPSKRRVFLLNSAPTRNDIVS